MYICITEPLKACLAGFCSLLQGGWWCWLGKTSQTSSPRRNDSQHKEEDHGWEDGTQTGKLSSVAQDFPIERSALALFYCLFNGTILQLIVLTLGVHPMSYAFFWNGLSLSNFWLISISFLSGISLQQKVPRGSAGGGEQAGASSNPEASSSNPSDHKKDKKFSSAHNARWEFVTCSNQHNFGDSFQPQHKLFWWTCWEVGPIVFLYMYLKIHMNSMHMYFRRLDYPVLWNILLHACFQVRRYLKEHTEGDSKQRLKDAQSAWMASDERAAFMGGCEGIQM